VLTAERRSELLALLDDEERLRAEFPKVSDYLQMAPTLPGTGNVQVDAAFDLRFVHYVTGGRAVSANPYWDLVSPFVHEYGGRNVVNGGNPEGSGRLAYAQMALQEIYAYAIPSPATIAWVADFCAGRRLVEHGAGRGYWAEQLTRGGVDVAAYDFEPPDKTDNASFSRAAGHLDVVWHHVGDLGEFEAGKDRYGDAVLFLCWPPGWGNTMASDVLREFEEAGGTRLIFIGQPRGGMTGDDAFFEALSAGWDLVSQDSGFVSWWNLLDVAQGWVRRFSATRVITKPASSSGPSAD
jgi:hypothetical protein